MFIVIIISIIITIIMSTITIIVTIIIILGINFTKVESTKTKVERRNNKKREGFGKSQMRGCIKICFSMHAKALEWG